MKEDETMDNENYGVWCISERCFEANADLTYNNAMGLALFCVEEDEVGVKNFCVVKMDEHKEPIWHEMVWCGGFQGYDWLYKECVALGEIVERTPDDDDVSYI